MISDITNRLKAVLQTKPPKGGTTNKPNRLKAVLQTKPPKGGTTNFSDLLKVFTGETWFLKLYIILQ